MSSNIDRYFTEDENKSIVEAIGRVEKSSSAEVVVAVADASDDYLEGLLSGSFWLSIILGSILSIIYAKFKILKSWDSDLDLIFLSKYLAVVISFIVLLYFIIKKKFILNNRFKLFFVDSNRKIDKCYKSAVNLFYEKGLYKTVDKTGFLIYLSFAERRVVILGDEGINNKIEPKKWEEYATKIAKGMRTSNKAENIVAVIEEIGVILAEELPVKPDDVNEISDEIIQA